MVTMKDVAKAAGVSIITVSRVINSPNLVKENTRIEVERLMKEMGFLPNHAAKALAENSTRAIHLYVPRTMGISDPFIMNLLAGVSEELSNAFYLSLIRRDMDFNQRCDGVIIMGLNLLEEKNFTEKFKVPIVLFGKTDLEVDCIDIDNFKGAVMMTENIIAKGHKRIGFIKINTDQRFTIERFEGYKKALENKNIPYEENLIRYAENTEMGGYNQCLDLIVKEKPTAIFCSNDLLAIGAFRAAEKLKLRVPEDISIAGFDGLVFDLVTKTPLTTVRQPVYEAGKRLAARLLERIKTPELPIEKSLISPELIIRDSIRNI